MGVVDLGVERVKLPNGLEIDLAIIRHPGACAVVALDEQDCVTLIEQYRHAVGKYLWEIPAGCREPSETSERCAERELLEEAGITAKRWERLGSLVTIPSFCDERIDLFFAREISYGTPRHEPDEVIRVQRVPLDEALAMIDRGDIVDAKTIAGLYRATAFLKNGQNTGGS
jgi:ADP-ribose pyrophosphatase